MVNLVNSTPHSDLPKIVIFFNNLVLLLDAYQYVTYYCHQAVGQESPTIVMYHMITDEEIKQQVLSDLGSTNGVIRCVFSSSSLSMGVNLTGIVYVVHYGSPTTAAAFLQETGRAARDPLLQGHSILLKYPRMSTSQQLDSTMREYLKGERCLRDILLGKFASTKPIDQIMCCDVCEPALTCDLKDIIVDSYECSVVDSFSDSMSIASLDVIEELDLSD